VETTFSGAPDKVDISRILMQRDARSSSTARVLSLDAADAVLAGWAKGMLAAGDDLCNVEIVFEDGFRYHGHYPLTPSEKRVSLSRHVRRHLTELAKSAGVAMPSALRDEPVISQIGATLAESARMALEHYNV
jgi:hypothetical protein